MTTKKTRVEAVREFLDDLKHLVRKYKGQGTETEVAQLINQLESGKTPGDRIPNVSYAVYKVRLKVRARASAVDCAQSTT